MGVVGCQTNFGWFWILESMHMYMYGVYSARFTISKKNQIECRYSSYTNTRWWFQICWFLTPILEGMIWMIHFDVHIFQMGWTTNWNGYCRAFSTWNVFYFPFRMCYRLVQCSGSEKLVGFHPHLGKIPILTNIFQRGWNHQLEKVTPINSQHDPNPLHSLHPWNQTASTPSGGGVSNIVGLWAS